MQRFNVFSVTPSVVVSLHRGLWACVCQHKLSHGGHVFLSEHCSEVPRALRHLSGPTGMHSSLSAPRKVVMQKSGDEGIHHA